MLANSHNSNRKVAAVHARKSAGKFSTGVVRNSHVHVKKYHAATVAGKAFVAGAFHIGISHESGTHKKKKAGAACRCMARPPIQL
jgi:hypothetical protein